MYTHRSVLATDETTQQHSREIIWSPISFHEWCGNGGCEFFQIVIVIPLASLLESSIIMIRIVKHKRTRCLTVARDCDGLQHGEWIDCMCAPARCPPTHLLEVQ